ncbi:hypothetical protein ACROYT_G017952 [Oculina patagonica]
MEFSYTRLFVIVILTSVVSSLLQSSSCPDVNLKPRKTLTRLRQSFLFVEKPSVSLQSSLGIPKRVSRNVKVEMPGTTMCPWTWSHDDNPDRVPRYLTKAVCPSCGHYCRAVFYYHRGLVQRCDVRTGEKVWKWTVVELPVAFVYDP